MECGIRSGRVQRGLGYKCTSLERYHHLDRIERIDELRCIRASRLRQFVDRTTQPFYGQFLFVNTFPYTEGFENGSPNLSCWTNIQEVGTADWTYAAGSSGGSISGAYSGSANARFVSLSPSGGGAPVTKLVSPPLDLSNMTAPRISLFYGQEVWYGDQNELKVYYRKSVNDPWVQLAHYTNNISSWTQIVLNLPSHTSTYQVAFEGINNWGRANVLDEVTIEESPTCPAPLNLVAFNVTDSSIDLSWDGGIANGWDVRYGLQGDPVGNGTLCPSLLHQRPRRIESFHSL